MMDILKPSFIKYFLREYTGKRSLDVSKILSEISVKFRDRWIKSGCSDFSIYTDTEYVFDMVHCYLTFTRNSINATKKILPKLKSVFDYYNGVGLSTIQAKILWPDADIYFFNDVKDQRDFMFRYCDRFRFKNHGIKNGNLEKYEAVFAFEVFEHMENPEDFFIKEIFLRTKKYLVFTAPFSEMWGGHFFKYHGVDSKKYKKRFKTFLMDCVFIEIFKGFNERPLIYENIRERSDV